MSVVLHVFSVIIVVISETHAPPLRFSGRLRELEARQVPGEARARDQPNVEVKGYVEDVERRPFCIVFSLFFEKRKYFRLQKKIFTSKIFLFFSFLFLVVVFLLVAFLVLLEPSNWHFDKPQRKHFPVAFSHSPYTFCEGSGHPSAEHGVCGEEAF